MKKRVLSATMTSLVALAMLIAGCASTPTTQAPAEQPKTETPAPAAEPAKTGPKQLIVGRGADTKGLDPITQTDGETFKVTENVMDTLIGFADGSTELAPSLAEKWEVSPDGLVYTLTLRSGVKFHDGTDFNAEAVKYNFERWSDKSHPQHSPEGFEYYISQFGGYKGDANHVIKSVEAVDPTTVKFTLTRPLAPFLANLAMSPFAIGSPEALKKDVKKFNEHPIGTGPFKFVEWKRNDTITLEKNPDYWSKGYPKLDKLVFKVIPENTARLTALASGEIDLMDGLNTDDMPAVKDNKDLQLFLRPTNNIGYIGFNVEKKPLDNPKVREAIAYAINKPEIVTAFFDGVGQPAVNPMPKTMWGHNNDIKDREFNLDKAKQLLAEAGHPNGFKIKFWAMPVPRPYMPEGVKIAEAIQQDLKKIGIDAEIVTMEWATYLEKTRLGEQEMFMLGWTGDNGDPDNFLAVLLDKNSIGSNNYTRWANDEASQLMMKAQSTPVQAEREKLYKQVQEIIFKDVPMVPLAHSTPALAGKANIVDYNPHPKGTESLEKVDFK
ncbi:ABC transporter substrate-binding protein [Brevibacillus fortis]|uniref:ABC transporter substrate-binding protein n=1 Tax=Brevibacillus fortis TaxID=2126352 RepID=A0A2P7UPW9_9BACL|nr:ABC transporter substrate-binding protein [Brevibacillus fortis]MED1783073.1 ABC transporter substrate-binding protein [Brevibacillus fortis]PSJ88945.1 ABC transporter substrate-binding protein [Brevibacillus fortis]